jgi:hypothetical protein
MMGEMERGETESTNGTHRESEVMRIRVPRMTSDMIRAFAAKEKITVHAASVELLQRGALRWAQDRARRR